MMQQQGSRYALRILYTVTVSQVSGVPWEGGVWGVQIATPPRNSEVLPKLSCIPSSVK
jgi:hypothetical protein